MDSAQLDARLANLRSHGGFDPSIVERFGTHLREAPDEDLFRMSPYQYAATAGIPERAAIDLFLYATHAGLLEFSWGVPCPGCGAFLTTAAALRSLESERRCRLCRIEVGVGIDENIHVAFTVAPTARNIRFHHLAPGDYVDFVGDGLRHYLTAGIQPTSLLLNPLTTGLRWRDQLQPGDTVAEVDLAPGYFILFVPRIHAAVHVLVHPGATAHALDVDVTGGGAIPEEAQLAPGPARITIHSRLPEAVFAVLADFSPVAEARMSGGPPKLVQRARPLSGKELVTAQAFRELFRAESIPSEGGLELKNLTVLFTDLKGSTALYHRIGDLRAYGLVRKHFGLLRDAVATRGGGIVKTIGDAIMATFAEPAAALEAAVAMHEEMERVGPDLQLKVGLHAGPCIAVELNERLDYFGQTVNLAARVQSIADAREIVCTDAILGSPDARHVVEQAALSVKPDSALLKGIEGETKVYRIQTATGSNR